MNARPWRGAAIAAVALVSAATSLVDWSNAARAQAGPPAFSPRDEDPGDYPAGPGRDDTFYSCTACHGFRIVAQQSMTRAQWDDSVTWMTERHGMPEITGADREVILTYLTTHFGPRAADGARGWRNPFSPQ